MALIEENSCICIKCEGTVRFSSLNENEKRRHVAIVHGRETFSRLRCGKCQRKYYDLVHFSEHLETSPECLKDSWMIKPEPLSDHLKNAFDALVEQMMRPINERTVKTDQMEKAPNSAGNGDGEMDRTNGEAAKRSMISSTGDQSDMDGAKRRRVMDTSATDGQNTTKGQRRSIWKNTGTMQGHDAYGYSGRGTGKRTAAGDDPSGVNEQFKFQLATLRRKYCFGLIDKFATAGKLQCQLCSIECVAIKGGTRLGRSIDRPIQHALRHLQKPIYRCRICNITKFTIDGIRNHVKNYLSSSKECYEDCADQYHKEIMDTLRLCYQVDKEKRQVQKRLAIPGQFYKDRRSPLHQDRLCCIRSLAARYSNQTHIACQLCSKMCRVNTYTGLLAIRNHVFGHLNKDIFQCISCGTQFRSYFSLQKHIPKYHQVQSIEGAYMDYSDKYHQEFMNMLGKCFDQDSGNGAMESKKECSGIRGGPRTPGTSGSGKTICGTGQGF